MGTISIKIIESDKVIKGRIIKAMVEELNNLFKRSTGSILTEIKKLTERLLEGTPEIISLQGGKLQGAFGIRKGEEGSTTLAIVKSIAESIVIEHIVINAAKSGGKIRGGMKIYIQPSNFGNLLSLSEGYTVFGTGGSKSIPWLRWLLTLGDKILIGDYHFEPSSGGRSTLGTMLPPGVFRVPPSYSGTEDDNFITRAFEKKEKEIARAINKGLR